VGSTSLTVTAATLTSISITAPSSSIAKGATDQFTATGTYSDSSTANITGTVTWNSATPAVASISAAGLATGAGVGSSNIAATLSGVTSNTFVLTVTAATLQSIAVTPANPTITTGLTQQFTATGTYSDSSTQNLTGSVTWASGTKATATITAGGLATAVAVGTSTISATSGSVVGSTALTVTAATLQSIAVTPGAPSVATGLTQQFTATGTYSDSSTQNLTASVTWVSATTATATIGTGGLASALAVGTSTISATSGSVVGSTALTVTASTAAISFVQAKAKAASSVKTHSVSFSSATVAGDLILVGFDFASSAQFSSITDSQGNTFTQVGQELVSPGGIHSRLYYASNINGGSDSVTVKLSATSDILEIYMAEYAGVSQAIPIDAQSGASGAAGSVSSGNATTMIAGDLIYGYCVSDSACTLGTGFTARSTLDENLTEDMAAGNPGSYGATASADGGWTMQMVALKPAINGTGLTAQVVTPSAKSATLSGAAGATAPRAVPVPVAQNFVVALSCLPREINAGGLSTCQLQVTANPASSQIQLTSSSPQVRIPATVATRANQTGLTFLASADAAARQQLVTVTATSGSATVQDTIQVTAASHPIITAPNSQTAKRGAPVRFTVSAADPADLPIQLAASNLPEGAIFKTTSGDFEWTPTAAQAGKHIVTFTATNAANQSSSAQVTVDVSSGTPTLATMDRKCSPAGVASVAGSSLSDSDSAFSDPSGNSMDLGGTKVKVNGHSVPVLSASSTEVSFVCPSLAPETQLALDVETASGVSGSMNTVMQRASPWIFVLGASEQNQGVVSFVGTTELAMARNSHLAAHPAQPGDEILLWGTGFGSSSEAQSGMVSVKVGGVDAEVDAVRAVPGRLGVYTVQVRVPVPTVFGDGVPVQIQVIGPDGNLFNSNSVAVAVEPAMQ
jgi:uncharacterized protein (TIGR03437 family)